MVKVNRPGSHKAGSDETQAEKKQSAQSQAVSQPASAAQASQKKGGKQGGKSRQNTIGGTAVQGAKSTKPKELSTTTPANQQPEYYNREMRRRMQQMGTGPYNERASLDPRERRRKRLERLKERQEEIKRLVDKKGPSRDIKLGRRNTYFVIAVALLLIALFVAFIIIRHPF